MDRRTSLKWMLAASAAMPLVGRRVSGETVAKPNPGVRGYGTDPDLKKSYRAGDLWPLVLTPAERLAAAALCDVIIPADEHSSSASAIGVVDFLDEWVSAPYAAQQKDRPVIVAGLQWLDAESNRRFAKPFAAATTEQQHAICDEVCHEKTAAPALAEAAAFFARYRDLTAGGFYSTPEGRRDIGYVGNVPQATFEGPPFEVLRKLGLAPVAS